MRRYGFPALNGRPSYAYALNSPLDISDPDGQFPKFPKTKPPKPTKPSPTRCTGPNVHPNCRNYKGKCYVYRIEAQDGSLWKYGESCKPAPLRKTDCEAELRTAAELALKCHRCRPPDNKNDH